MAYARKRRYRRTYRRRSFRRLRRYRGRRRIRRRARSTRSAVVKLTMDGAWRFAVKNGDDSLWNAFTFAPVNILGFNQYLDTYTHFRILKCYLNIGREVTPIDQKDNPFPDSNANNYIFVGSRAFASVQVPISSPVTEEKINIDALVPPQKESTLRQSRWQTMKYPNTTKTKVSVGFYPYTLITTGGPAYTQSSNSVMSYQRVYEARRWMPITWIGGSPGDGNTSPGTGGAGLTFFGPYMIVDVARRLNDGELPGGYTWTANIQLVLRVQFKGQH
ncbi:capsid protein [Myodefec virus RodL3_773]|uniref:Capsid protein n=1 Tax=Myodefec virus RodL3_773 TaxID=2929258 RepID=A0A976N274_9VIRU|nr:capsid protein [Myodefec virus RodL3_773]